MDQNIDFFGDDQIQTLQYPDVQENSFTNNEFEVYMNDMQFKLDNLQQDFQKKFEQKQGDFLNQMRNFMQNFHDGPPIPPPEASEEQKQKMEDTMFELVKICQEKEFLCIHDDVDDLIESALNSKLLLINSNSQRLDKKGQEVKNIIEQPTERGSLAPILSTKESEHLLSMGYEHLSITPETESDEVTESNAENLLPIPSKCEDGDSQREEIDIVTETDDVLPPSIENIADDPEGDIRFLEELLIDDSILSHESFDSNFEDNPLIPRPPPESPDAETDIEEEIAVVMTGKDKFDDDYQFLMFDKVFSLLFAKSEDTIFDPGISD
nr:hypothetical protein [Tanacetum cinerariifolium]